MMNWTEKSQVIANIATPIAILITLFVFASESCSNRNLREFESFLTLLDEYERTVEERRSNWVKLKGAVRSNPKIAHEIDDKQDAIGYLLIRIEQDEPMFAIEHAVLEYELSSLNFLNKLCEVAMENERSLQILLLTDSREISYYQYRLEDLLKLYDSQREHRKFSKPSYESISKFDVADYIDPNE